ncbi:hypothetical protein V8F06_008540 [Rhypophila decipiens]
MQDAEGISLSIGHTGSSGPGRSFPSGPGQFGAFLTYLSQTQSAVSFSIFGDRLVCLVLPRPFTNDCLDAFSLPARLTIGSFAPPYQTPGSEPGSWQYFHLFLSVSGLDVYPLLRHGRTISATQEGEDRPKQAAPEAVSWLTMFNLHRVPLLTTTAALVIALVLSLLPVTDAQSTSCTNATFAVKLRNCTFESGVTSWGNLIEVGTPPQRLCLVPSTVINSTLVSQESLCLVSQTLEPHKCEALRGGFFNENSSSTWTDVSLVKYNDTRSNPTWEHFNPPGFTKVGYDKIVFPNTDPPVDLYGAGIALNQYGNNSNAGMIGLGINSVFLNDGVRQGRAGSKSWSLDAGSNSLVKPREGEMVIGGYNSARTDGSFSWSNVSNMAGDRPCPLRTRITEMSVTLGDGSIVPIISSAETADACIEPYDNLFRFTPGMLFNWKSITKFNETLLQVYTSETANNNLSFTELGLPYDSAMVDDNWQLSISLDNGYKTTLPSFELQRPLMGFDNFGNKDAVPGITNLQILNVPTGEGEVPTLGKIFLSRVRIPAQSTTLYSY